MVIGSSFSPVTHLEKAVVSSLREKFVGLVPTLPIMDESDVQDLREEWEKSRDACKIIAQKGGQTNILKTEADIAITGGSRGCSKTYSLLMNAVPDVTNKDFRAIIFRKEIDDLSDIIDTSYEVFGQFGTYNRAKNDMTWNFNSGGWLTFSFHDMDYPDFHDRYQGKQYSFIGIDEVTQISYKKFKVLTMSNRNAYGIRNRIVGTCNPDPDSWVAKLISWWIGADGLPIPERAGVVRYCFMDGDDVSQIVWGNTREECFNKCKDTLLSYWSDEYSRFGTPEELFIKSVTFVPAKLAENVALMTSNPEYIANLIGQDEETRARFLDGNWKYKATGDDLIKMEDIERFYDNPIQTDDGVRRVSCDAALDGGDMCVFWLWEGNHILDVYTCRRDSKTTIDNAKALLERWRVREENFTYDLNGIGHIFKGYFPKALPFNNKEGVEEKYKGMYYNLKAQAAQYFADHVKDGTFSINGDLLSRRFSGKGYENKTLREILNEERRCIRFREDDPTRLIDKATAMKKLIHRSPDFVEGLLMREIFNIKNVHHKPRNLGLLGVTHEGKSSGFFKSGSRSRAAFRFRPAGRFW